MKGLRRFHLLPLIALAVSPLRAEKETLRFRLESGDTVAIWTDYDKLLQKHRYPLQDTAWLDEAGVKHLRWSRTFTASMKGADLVAGWEYVAYNASVNCQDDGTYLYEAHVGFDFKTERGWRFWTTNSAHFRADYRFESQFVEPMRPREAYFTIEDIASDGTYISRTYAQYLSREAGWVP